jgi:DNA-binding FrmR family transcriptional regulator
MSDTACADVLKRLACVGGHLDAIAQMVERGEDDLAVAHQIQAVRGALVQIQVRLLRVQLDWWADQTTEPDVIENALIEILKMRRPHEFNFRHVSRLPYDFAAEDG